MACALSEDSDQPGHSPSLIRIFAVRMKKAWVLSYPLSGQRRQVRLDGCPGWSESLLDAHSLCWFWHEAAQINYFTRYWCVSRLINKLVIHWTKPITVIGACHHCFCCCCCFLFIFFYFIIIFFFFFCSVFTALQHILGHFGRGQLS